MKKLTNVLISTLLLAIFSNAAIAQNVTVTWVGNGTSGFNGNGLAGVNTVIGGPYDVCIDAAHNIYFTDNGNGMVRKISAVNGTISTVAGGGISSADGIPATDAYLAPTYMCIDPTGNLFVVSTNEVRRIDAFSGIITTVAGNGATGYSGDGGPAIAATFSAPSGICIDAAGNIYVTDNGNSAIRKITAATGIINTIAGMAGSSGYTGDGGSATAATLANPVAICINAAGDVFFTDQDGAYIRKITAASGIISTIAGNGGPAAGDGGPALLAGLGNIWGMCIDGSGNIYCDDISCSCRKINMSTGIINTVAGSLTADGYNGDGSNSLFDYLNFPFGLCVDASGSIYIADNGNYRIRKAIQLSHTPSFSYGKGQYINPCPGASFAINQQLSITDLDAGQTETWTVISAPANGTLAGFPYTATSVGTSGLVVPVGLAYTPVSGFSGADYFTVVVSDGGLSDTVVMYVNVAASGTDAGAIIAPATLCADGSVTLDETVAGGVWTVTNSNAYISGGILYASMSGTDTIVYAVTAGCTAYATSVITILNAPDPGVITGTGSGTILIGTTTDLSDYVVGGAWSSDNTSVATVSSSGTVSGISSGGADILYTTSNGECTATAEYYIYVVADSTTGIANTAMQGNSITVVPNPAKENFTINISSSFDEVVSITVTNIIGEKIKEITGNTNHPISAALDVAPGLYLLNAATAHGNISAKVIME